MALDPIDEPTKTFPVPAVPFALRLRTAILTLYVPYVDSSGKIVLGQELEASVNYDDPTLTDAQRTQFLATAKFIARKNGVIP
jgi:hypothetical protein